MGCLPTNLVTHSSGRLRMCFPSKLFSKTKGPINLLPSKPHHTFTENVLWNLVTLVSCGLSWNHVCTFHELFILSQAKDASSLNKMTLNSWDVLLSSGTNPYVEQSPLVPDVVP